MSAADGPDGLGGVDGLCQEAQEDEPVEHYQHPRVNISEVIHSAFVEHCNHLRESRRRRRQALQIQTVVPQSSAADDDKAGPSSSQPQAVASAIAEAAATPGQALPSDVYEGDCVLRTLNQLLAMVDDRGYARSPQQCQFHDAFIRACSRVMYRADWSKSKPMIMEHNKWNECPSQILVSTPRRFGKTFSIAIFVAALSLACGLEVVVFSPARRASRKLLERIVEFLRLLDCGDRITEYNQEQCRLKSFTGKMSLIRSFPSKVSVSFCILKTRTRYHPHAGRYTGGTQHTHKHTALRFIYDLLTSAARRLRFRRTHPEPPTSRQKHCNCPSRTLQRLQSLEP